MEELSWVGRSKGEAGRADRVLNIRATDNDSDNGFLVRLHQKTSVERKRAGSQSSKGYPSFPGQSIQGSICDYGF